MPAEATAVQVQGPLSLGNSAYPFPRATYHYMPLHMAQLAQHSYMVQHYMAQHNYMAQHCYMVQHTMAQNNYMVQHYYMVQHRQYKALHATMCQYLEHAGRHCNKSAFHSKKLHRAQAYLIYLICI